MHGSFLQRSAILLVLTNSICNISINKYSLPGGQASLVYGYMIKVMVQTVGNIKSIVYLFVLFLPTNPSITLFVLFSMYNFIYVE